MNAQQILETAKTLTFGTELEYTNISREKAVKAVRSVVGGRIDRGLGGIDAWTVTAPDGRVWKAVRDSSLGSPDTSAEVVTPILGWDDIETLQKVVRALRKAGACTPECTSQHVHIGIADFTAAQIANFARIWYKQEELLLKALGTLPARIARYTKPADRAFIERLETMKPKTREDLNIAWYGYSNPNPAHYNATRYRAINLNNVWRTQTVEIRAFNGTTHAGVVRTNILLALMTAALAKNAKCATTKHPRPFIPETAKYDMRVFLLRIGFIGELFRNPRRHLIGNLQGNASWRNGRP